MKQDRILIIDMGSTKNTDIAREIRSFGVFTEIHPLREYQTFYSLNFTNLKSHYLPMESQ